MEKLYKTGMLVLVVVIFVSFFLPWISVDSAAVGGISKLLTGKGQARIDSISGFRVPILANSKESRFMVSVIKIFNPKVKDADRKSWLIWLVPGLAIGLFITMRFFKNNKWFYLAVGLLGSLIFFVAVFKIVTTDLDKLILKVNIGGGLWLLLIGYFCLGILNLIRFVSLIKKRNRDII